MRHTLADCLRPWLIFVAITLLLGGAAASYGTIRGILGLLKFMKMARSVPWQATVGLLLMIVALAAVVAYAVAGFFLFVFQQKMDVFLRREAGWELNRAMWAYKMFWLLIYSATFTVLGVFLIGLLLDWAS